MKRRLDPIPVTPVFSIVPSLLLILMILLLACATFVDPGFVWFGGTVCMAMALVGCVWFSFHDHRRVMKIARDFDWGTAAFLAGVFVLVGMLDNRGVIEAVVGRLGALGGRTPSFYSRPSSGRPFSSRASSTTCRTSRRCSPS